MSWALVKPKLRKLVLGVLLASLTVLLWAYFTRGDGQLHFEVTSVVPVGNYSDVTLQVTNESNRRFTTDAVSNATPFITLRDQDNADIIFFQYVDGGKLVDLGAVRIISEVVIPPGKQQSFTIRLATYDTEERYLVPGFFGSFRVPFWAQVYFALPKAMRPKPLERRVNEHISGLRKTEGEPFRAADWLEQSATSSHEAP